MARQDLYSAGIAQCDLWLIFILKTPLKEARFSASLPSRKPFQNTLSTSVSNNDGTVCITKETNLNEARPAKFLFFITDILTQLENYILRLKLSLTLLVLVH